MQQWLKEVARGKKGAKDLSFDETVQIAQTIISGEATDAQLAAYLVAERIKMESPEELYAFIYELKKQTQFLDMDDSFREQLIDFAGPYNGRNSFAATIPVSLLLADYQVPTFIAASDTLPPKYGLSLKSIIQELGMPVGVDPQSTSHTLKDDFFAFADTETFCPSLADVRNVRQEIGVRTLFNTVEKLLNISGAKNVMLGAFHRTAINKLNDVFQQLDYQHVYMVQGLEGSEDVPVHRNSFVFHWTPEKLTSFSVKPKTYGLECKDFDKHQKLSAHEQSEIIQSLLSGEQRKDFQYYYYQVLLNAGLRYYLFGITEEIEEGIDIARKQLADGNVIERLKSKKETT
ncbi:glycosyl transferase [Gracilibacillus halophilus YIM-C55.5]|uniref:Glycosyl transferase n=1 Tax=Gracilibacillus halophilus YIM-C55.5 TaxID=1308866 RepID=N4WVQ3_9BACI|nr:glycosyl transferase [Gracilibacillus halophilus]ENH97161.1 glycosyl transferase [Gracilibacillus halophilus YIM-C55.5]